MNYEPIDKLEFIDKRKQQLKVFITKVECVKDLPEHCHLLYGWVKGAYKQFYDIEEMREWCDDFLKEKVIHVNALVLLKLVEVEI